MSVEERAEVSDELDADEQGPRLPYAVRAVGVACACAGAWSIG